MKNMKTKLLSNICLIIVTAISFSCADMLDVEVKSSISGDAYWKSENDFMPNLYGIYSRYRILLGNDNMVITEDRSEMWKAGYNNRFSSYWAQTITAGQTVDWTSHYKAIGHCNLLLYQLERFNFSNQTLKKQITAEAYAIRASLYFELAKIFGDVPLVLDPVFSENEPLHARTPVMEVFTQINKDIVESLSLMTSDGYIDKYRFSKPAVYALLADVKMWSASVLGGGEKDYLEAISAIDKVEASGVTLLGTYGNVFDNRKNNEIIFSIYLERSEYTSGKYNEAFLRFDTSGGADNVSELPIALAGQQGYCLSDRALTLFSQYPQDKRISRTYIPEIMGGVNKNYWPNKLRGTQYSDERIADSDIIAYRLSYMYLLKAEAYAAVNKPTESLEYLNKVRIRADIPEFTDTDLAVLKKEILDEQGREMFHELKRWWDLRRAHASSVIDVYTFLPNYVGKTTPLYWAVHTNVLRKNETLVQTDGYQ